MYKRELENALLNGKIANYFLLFGADEYQIELFAKEILTLYKKEETNILSLYFNEYDYARALSHLSEPSLFGGENLLHIKTDKKIASKELKELIKACEKDKNNFFLYEFYELDTKITTEIQRTFGLNFARFFKPNNPEEALQLLARQAGKIGLNITKNALYELYFIHNENLYLAAGELNKLASLNTHIEQDTVRKLVFGLGSVNFDDFFNKFISLKDIKKDFFTYEQDPIFNEILFINSLYKSFFRLFKLYSYIKINGKFDIKEAIGYAPPQNVANALKTQSLSLNLKTYADVFIQLNLAESELKTNPGIDKSAYLLSTILNLQNIISTAKIK
ncbi:DNA polymerase III subunit delta [Campylobacter californiensis]|uniref:DNA polymerase III subunit delta n=1 Tax=Campylobacter californiensis TaxID=1032243 RepID=UPI0014758B8A|nr:DNA polymerase III subunit delta [Campylobacter sp. RM12916]MBE3609934.1 DNA polymerase III subunit delta [Campylobacter sp. RM12916]